MRWREGLGGRRRRRRSRGDCKGVFLIVRWVILAMLSSSTGRIFQFSLARFGFSRLRFFRESSYATYSNGIEFDDPIGFKYISFSLSPSLRLDTS
jgi:hypothetical protein